MKWEDYMILTAVALMVATVVVLAVVTGDA